MPEDFETELEPSVQAPSPEPSVTEPQGEPQAETQPEPEVDVKALIAERDRYKAERETLQSSKDREVQEARQQTAYAQRQHQEYLQRVAQMQNQQERAAWEQLARDDPVSFAEQSLARQQQLETAATTRQQTYSEYGISLLTELWNDPEYADLSQEEKTTAYNTAMTPALQQGRNATVAEINRELVRAVKAKTGAPMNDLREQLKQVQAEIRALKGENAGEAVRGSEGPESPAPASAPRGKFTPERISKMTDSEYEANREAIMAWQAGG